VAGFANECRVDIFHRRTLVFAKPATVTIDEKSWGSQIMIYGIEGSKCGPGIERVRPVPTLVHRPMSTRTQVVMLDVSTRLNEWVVQSGEVVTMCIIMRAQRCAACFTPGSRLV
jgi:hypothetical protein